MVYFIPVPNAKSNIFCENEQLDNSIEIQGRERVIMIHFVTVFINVLIGS